MATKALKKSPGSRTPNARDALVELFVAEDVRSETGGKITLVGMYPDRVIVALVPPDAPEPSSEVPLAIDSVALLVNIRNLVGEHRVSIEIGGKPGGAQTVQFTEVRSSVNLVAKARPLLIASFGVKTVTIKVDEAAFSRTFEVRRGVAPASPSAVPAPASRRKLVVGKRVKTVKAR